MYCCFLNAFLTKNLNSTLRLQLLGQTLLTSPFGGRNKEASVVARPV